MKKLFLHVSDIFGRVKTNSDMFQICSISVQTCFEQVRNIQACFKRILEWYFNCLIKNLKKNIITLDEFKASFVITQIGSKPL